MFTRSGLTLLLQERDESGRPARHVVKLGFVDAADSPAVELLEAQSGTVSTFRGGPDAWRAGARSYGRVIYRQVWPGIDVEYTLSGDELKAKYLVAPGADPRRIRIAVGGTESLQMGREGELEARAGRGRFVDPRPVAFQEGAAGDAVEASYQLYGDREFGFRIGEYDRSRLLVIDPAVVVAGTFLGGAANDTAIAIATDTAGNLYIAGSTSSSEKSFPEKAGPDTTFNGASADDSDGYIAKLDPSGEQLLWCGYLGGSDEDVIYDLAVDAAGNAYVTGFTESAGSEGFPLLTGPGLTYRGGRDVFVAKVNSSGSALDYCGYLGGTGSGDTGTAIAVDGSGHAYVGGYTNSSASSFPVTGGPDVSSNGGYDGFIAKVKPTGNGLVYCGYLGGSATDAIYDLALDSQGRPVVTGVTASTQATFPVSGGADSTQNGGDDAFVARVSASGASMDWCSFLGGSEEDEGESVAVDANDDVIVVGETKSSEATFPVAVGPDLTFNGCDYDAFITKFDASGGSIVFSGYLGGSGCDKGTAVTTDLAGNVYLVGNTFSSHDSPIPFPVVGGPDSTYGGKQDGFLAVLPPNGAALLSSGYLGGSDSDYVHGVTLDATGSVHVVGSTDSKDLPMTGGPDATYNQDGDGFHLEIKVLEFVAAPAGATMDLVLKKGAITDSPKAGKDRLTASGSVIFNSASPDGTFNPLSDSLTLWAGDSASPVVISIPAGDSGWKSAKGKHTWKSPAGTSPKAQIVLDLTKQTFSIALSNFSFPAHPENPMRIRLALGNDLAGNDAVWKLKKPGVYSMP